jgi:hypothetical protein
MPRPVRMREKLPHSDEWKSAVAAYDAALAEYAAGGYRDAAHLNAAYAAVERAGEDDLARAAPNVAAPIKIGCAPRPGYNTRDITSPSLSLSPSSALGQAKPLGWYRGPVGNPAQIHLRYQGNPLPSQRPLNRPVYNSFPDPSAFDLKCFKLRQIRGRCIYHCNFN